MQEKYDRLKGSLREMGSVVVAYSGGVDSTLLLKVAVDCLGDRAVGLTAVSASLATHEKEAARDIARLVGARHIEIESHETENPQYLSNTPQRCFFCKNDVFDRLVAWAGEHGFRHVVDGTNLDDSGDHRPGRQAAREHGVRSPLMEAGMTKEDIRTLAHSLGLPNWDKPAAACLSSRVPYGMTITLEMLDRIGQAELALKQLGFGQLRVRHHDQVARLELEPEQLALALQKRDEIVKALKGLGYLYVTLDLSGFRSGSMNEVLGKNGSA